MAAKPRTPDAEGSVDIACTSCKACCCRLEVMLMSEDDIPRHLTEQDRWGGQIMARLPDGWCAALERDTMLCGIYERRPTICRDFEMGGSECREERLKIPTLSNDGIMTP